MLSSQRPSRGIAVIQCWSRGCQLGQGEPQCICHSGVFLSGPAHRGCSSEGVYGQWPEIIKSEYHFHNYQNAFQPKAVPWYCCYSMLVPWMSVGPRRAPVYLPFWRVSFRPSPPGMLFWGCLRAVAWRASLQPGCPIRGLQTQTR